MIKIYQNKNRYFIGLFLLLSGLWSNIVVAQTTILSTEAGANYTGTSGVVTGPGAVTFVVQNTNSYAVTLKQVDLYLLTNFNNTIPKLWYSASSLSGAPTIATPTWTLVTTGTAIPVPAPAYYPVLSNLAVNIPANTQYRFAVETSIGIGYTAATAAPTPSEFSANGLTLKVGDADIAGSAVGYGGLMPAPNFVPRFFTGRVTLCTSTVNATAPVLTPDTVLCGSGSITLRVTGGNLNDAANWRWYTGSCGGTAVGTGATLTVSPTTNTTYFVRGEGGCAAANGPCSSVAVAVSPAPGLPTVNPVSPICEGSVQALTISPLALTPGSVTINSAALSLAVPDNTANGVNTALTVAGVPAGATITGIDVTLNMTHTYIGDMLFNLRGPNGQILNLVKYLTATGNEGENFVNTVISSTGVDNLSSGTAPFTGIFKPDAINTAIGTAPVQNPAGFVSNAAAFANIYTTTPNGAYTLAMADGGPADVGTLTGWSITVRYTTSAPAQPAIWVPSTNLYTDAAATIPYDGTTARFEVFAKPSTTTSYTATSFLNGCYSAPVNTTVVVNNPIAITSSPANAEICEFATAGLKVRASGTSPTYQWLVNNGTTISNIANDANYAGATTDSLSVINAPAAWNGYTYACIVTSTAPCTGFDTSAFATLTVNPTPVVTLALSSNTPYTNLLPGMTATLQVSSVPQAASYTWFKNDIAVDGQTASSIDLIVDDQGIYKSTIIDINGCTATSSTIEITDSVSAKLFIYPNPAPGGLFSVSYHSVKGNVLPRILTIYDSKGALVLKQTFTLTKPYDKMNVDFSGLSKGLYFVNLLDNAKNRIATGKVIVK